jgi:hypothetical protein
MQVPVQTLVAVTVPVPKVSDAVLPQPTIGHVHAAFKRYTSNDAEFQRGDDAIGEHGGAGTFNEVVGICVADWEVGTNGPSIHLEVQEGSLGHFLQITRKLGPQSGCSRGMVSKRI